MTMLSDGHGADIRRASEPLISGLAAELRRLGHKVVTTSGTVHTYWKIDDEAVEIEVNWSHAWGTYCTYPTPKRTRWSWRKKSRRLVWGEPFPVHSIAADIVRHLAAVKKRSAERAQQTSAQQQSQELCDDLHAKLKVAGIRGVLLYPTSAPDKIQIRLAVSVDEAKAVTIIAALRSVLEEN